MNQYADIILPLALPGAFTYLLPEHLHKKVAEGCRVVVPLGKRKFYTGIVTRLHNDAPTEAVEMKSVCDVVDEQPLVLPKQLDFWQWLSYYYMCTQGEVMKAALPSGLKLESETLVARR